MIKNVKRTLSVRATSENLRLLVLSKEAFERILGSIRDYLKEDYRDGQEFLDTSFESESKKNNAKAIETDELVQI